MNMSGKTVVATRRLWKLLSTTQFKGSTEISMENMLNLTQKDLKSTGKSVKKKVEENVMTTWEQKRELWYGSRRRGGGDQTDRVECRNLG
jgi:hypothetical protein